jgi:hypothetical protein
MEESRMSAKDIAARHLAAALADADAASVPPDVLGRAMLSELIDLWRKTRSAADIRSELEFVAGNLDDDAEFYFMRP